MPLRWSSREGLQPTGRPERIRPVATGSFHVPNLNGNGRVSTDADAPCEMGSLPEARRCQSKSAVKGRDR